MSRALVHLWAPSDPGMSVNCLHQCHRDVEWLRGICRLYLGNTGCTGGWSWCSFCSPPTSLLTALCRLSYWQQLLGHGGTCFSIWGVSSAMCCCLAGWLQHCSCAVSPLAGQCTHPTRVVGEAHQDGEICVLVHASSLLYSGARLFVEVFIEVRGLDKDFV